MSFDEDRELVIRGVLHKWETDGSTDHPATLIQTALERIFHECWSVVVYDSFVEETGSGARFVYADRLWVYGVRTTQTLHDAEKLSAFMDSEFGWATLEDIEGFQTAAERRVNAEFEGRWNVHVVVLPRKSRLGASIYGAYWKHDDFICHVMRADRDEELEPASSVTETL